MGDLDKHIRRKEEPSPYEKIIVNPIEKDKREKQAAYTGLKNSTRTQILATLMSYFKKILTLAGGRERAEPFSQQILMGHALAFRQLLILLSEEDQSHNPDFCEQLSLTWHDLLDDCSSRGLSTPITSGSMQKMQFFIAQIQNFPLGADHTLGYYFTQYAGKDWIPFPFMELLQDLHTEYQASPVISVLQNWISLLDDILSSGEIKDL